MTTRNIYIIGQGYSSTPVTANVSINGTNIYSGTVPTVDQPIAVSQGSNNSELQLEMVNNKAAIFAIERDVLFTGDLTVSLEVAGGPIWFGDVLANYASDRRVNPNLTPEQQAIVNDPASTNEQLTQVRAAIANPPFTAEEIATIQSTPNTFPYPAEIDTLISEHNAQLIYRSSGPTGFMAVASMDGTINNTWSSVTINGVLQPVDPNAYNTPRTGTWWWILNSGDVFQGTLRIPAGFPTP